MTTAEHLLGAGDEALAASDWSTARQLFSDALAQGEAPEALEGLATASFFLDDVEVAIDARERAFSAYQAGGRPIDAARVAIALAWAYRSVRGDRAVGDGWLARARRLLDGCEPAAEHGWLALREASFALPGDTVFAQSRCAEAAELGRALGDVDLQMTALALEGLARVSQGRVAEGMACLDEATTAATAGEMRDPIAIGFSCCYLIFACERVRDFDRAGQWCERLARMAEGWNIRSLRAVCRAHYGTVLVLRGEWAEAETVLLESAAAQTARPAEAADALARLAELRRRQGRTADALELAARAEHHPTAVLAKAAIALERGDAPSAVDGARTYLRMLEGAKTERAPGLELIAEAAAANGDTAAAEEAARELREIADAARTSPLLGAARQADAHAHAAAGRSAEAREAFDDAVHLLGRAGLPFEAARARLALGQMLHALGRSDAAEREIELARARLAELGAAGELRRVDGFRSRRQREHGAGLSPREEEILALVAGGLSNKQIAAELTLSEHTVHRHVANILLKLGMSSRTAAAAYAARRGLAG